MYSLLDSISVSETWHLISQGGSDVPSPRHRHTAVLHDNAMWVYGGMNDLQEKSDFWRFDFGMYCLLSFIYISIQCCYIVLIPVIVYFPLLCICNYVSNYLYMYVSIFIVMHYSFQKMETGTV